MGATAKRSRHHRRERLELAQDGAQDFKAALETHQIHMDFAAGLFKKLHPDVAKVSDLTDEQRNKLRASLVECRDKFLHIGSSTDDADTKRHAATVARDAWNAELPGHVPFVKACLEAAGRVGKGGKVDDERDYLDGLIERAVG